MNVLLCPLQFCRTGFLARSMPKDGLGKPVLRNRSEECVIVSYGDQKMSDPSLGGVLRFLSKACALQGTCDLTDRELVERFISQRDEGAFTFLVRRHGPMIFSVCRRFLGDAHEAEDALQAAFLVLVRRTRSIRKQESVGSWLYGVAKRIALRSRSQNAARRNREREATTKRARQPIDGLSTQELHTALHEAISSLPEKYRAPIILCYLEGRSLDRAARELNCPKTSLARVLAKGRELLRGKLERRGITLTIAALATALTEMAAAAPLPATLTIKTVKAATLMATGKALAGGFISANVLALADGAIKGVFVMKAKLVLLAVTLGLTVGGRRAGTATKGIRQLPNLSRRRRPNPERPRNKRANPPKITRPCLRRTRRKVNSSRASWWMKRASRWRARKWSSRSIQSRSGPFQKWTALSKCAWTSCPLSAFSM